VTPKDLFVTLCALTGQTERFAGKLGVGYFLPALFRLRYSNMGGLDVVTFARQLSELKTFEEPAWCATAILTNGLEGTVQEICIPNLKYQDRGMGMFVMEMPGAYAYKKPMSPASEEIYRGVIDHVAGLPRVDTDNISLVGVSFGGYWAARMAARDARISKAVVCGAPLQYAFGPQGSIGTPEIIISALKKVTGADDLKSLQDRLGALSFDRGDLYSDIKCPTLIINGDNDTLVGTKDSIILNARVPTSFLKLYADDDHCAMGHYTEWLDLTVDWLMGVC
jgi:esterase FrsA